MSKTLESETPALKGPGSARRKAFSTSAGGLVEAQPPAPDVTLPLIVRPAVKGVELGAWAAGNAEFIRANLLRHGALLFRDFNVRTTADFQRFLVAAGVGLMEYRERSSPRSQVGENIYTSTDYPADQSIFPHNEHSYSQTFPLKLFFYCLAPAEQGGETPLADCRKVFQRLDPAVRERFIRRKWMYVRNYGGGFGLTWQSVFQTDQKSEVEAYCREKAIEVEWTGEGRLRTRQVRPVVAMHPHTGEPVWFNHATFFHVSTLEPSMREALLAEFGEEGLPNNTYYGDGSPIEPSVLDELREAYRQEMSSLPWQQGDIMLLDNMLTAHARMPFVGPRKILFAMAEPFTRTDI